MGVQPHTLAPDRAAAPTFVIYLDEYGFVADGPKEWDDWLSEYKNDRELTEITSSTWWPLSSSSSRGAGGGWPGPTR